MSDKKYLFKRNNVWWVKLAVPLSLRSELGYDLRRTTGEKDLDKAIPIRDKIIEEFKTEFQIRKVNADDKGIVLRGTEHMQKTDISDPQYFHKVVDCQYACPAHTNVPEYIRLIAQKKYDDAYMLNWESNVFPGILGRTCDRPCEPACRRGRTHDKPVAICRLKRVTYDYKNDIDPYLPDIPKVKNGKKIGLIGAGPASLTVARDLLPLGYEVTIFEKDNKPGGLMRTNIPSFRLPAEVLDEEVYRIIKMGAELKTNSYIDSLEKVLSLIHI